jgi:hypothetical protein
MIPAVLMVVLIMTRTLVYALAPTNNPIFPAGQVKAMSRLAAGAACHSH